MHSHNIEPDADLTPAQVELVVQLTYDEIEEIDKALLANTSDK